MSNLSHDYPQSEKKTKTILFDIAGNTQQGFFPVFWEHDPYPYNWKFQRGFVKNWDKILD